MENNRQHKRYQETSLVIAINGSIFKVLNWSFGGFQINKGNHEFNVDTLIIIDGIGEAFNGRTTTLVTVSIPARITRLDEGRSIAIICLQLDDAALSLLQQHEDEYH